MITNDRIYEKEEYLHDSPVRKCEKLQYLYSTVRQGLYQYFQDSHFDSILLPCYIPEGIYSPFEKLGYKIYYYDIDINGEINEQNLNEYFMKYSPDIFIYIHYFGIYNIKNINLINKVKLKSTIFIEDFAHTLPHSNIVMTGDICVFSFPKMIGVTEGGLLWFNNKKLFKKCKYSLDDKNNKLLRRKMHFQLIKNNIILKINNYLWEKIISMLFINIRNYYYILMNTYTGNISKISFESMNILNRADFDKIFLRRKYIASIYYNNLDKNIKINLPREYFLKQALFGFPILVKNRKAFSLFLRKNGIKGLILNERWWFRKEGGNKDLFNYHYILPMNHYISINKIYFIINKINQFVKNSIIE